MWACKVYIDNERICNFQMTFGWIYVYDSFEIAQISPKWIKIDQKSRNSREIYHFSPRNEKEPISRSSFLGREIRHSIPDPISLRLLLVLVFVVSVSKLGLSWWKRKVRFHSVNIEVFFCWSDFTWNQIVETAITMTMI